MTGAAMTDRRLAIGDQILKVNEIDLALATHEQALNALRQTSNFIKLQIYRGFVHSDYSDVDNNNNNVDNNENNENGEIKMSGFESKSYYTNNKRNISEDEQHLNVLSIDLVKKFAKGLGFSIIGRRDGSGVFLSHIVSVFYFFKTYVKKPILA